MLKREEIIRLLEEEGIDLGDNPERVFTYYVERRLLLPAEGRDGKYGLYPDETVELLKKIKEYQAEGWTLAQIKERFDRTREKKIFQTQREDFEEFDHHQEIHNRIVKLLGLDEDQAYDMYALKRADTKKDKTLFLAVIAFNESGQVSWFNIDITDPGHEAILGKKTMTLREYNLFVQTLATTRIEKGKVLRRKDIFEKILGMYF